MAEAHKVIVIGAGIGGLVSSLLLAARGLDVTLVESGDAPGGKMRAVQVDGVNIDAGPTVFTMRWVFDEILADVGASLDALVALTPPLRRSSSTGSVACSVQSLSGRRTIPTRPRSSRSASQQVCTVTSASMRPSL